MAEQMYKNVGANAQNQGGGATGPGGAGPEGDTGNGPEKDEKKEKVIDADFKEV